MTSLDNASTEVTVRYRSRDGWHLFTSDQIGGLFVASPDLKVAFDDVPKAISVLMKLDHGFDCVVQPKLDYAQFIELMGLREKAQDAVEDRTKGLMETMQAAGCAIFPFTIGSCLGDQTAT